jgi:hypothetical protein
MTRPTRTAALGLLLLAALAGCSSGESTQSGEEDEVRELLVARDVDNDDADEIADCVAAGLFDTERFTKEERNEVTRATDSDVDDELRQRVEALFDECGLPPGS